MTVTYIMGKLLRPPLSGDSFYATLLMRNQRSKMDSACIQMKWMRITKASHSR